jgi:vacuolar-type H+-ATPase subunit H
MNDRDAPDLDPEFGLRLLGYSRREVDRFVAVVRRELRTLDPFAEPPGGVRLIPAAGSSLPQGTQDEDDDESGEAERGAVARIIGYAQEEADRRLAGATTEAEQTLRGARELADQILDEARRRAAELESRVAQTLDRELATRVGELARTHARMVDGLSGMRDTLAELLAADADLGPLEPDYYRDLVPQQRDMIAARDTPTPQPSALSESSTPESAAAPPLRWPEPAYEEGGL